MTLMGPVTRSSHCGSTSAMNQAGVSMGRNRPSPPPNWLSPPPTHPQGADERPIVAHAWVYPGRSDVSLGSRYQVANGVEHRSREDHRLM